MIERATSRRPRGETASVRGMVRVPGGAFLMGSNDFYPEERPVHRVAVEGFWMDQHPVTNAEFHAFVEDTGYVTVAERQPDPADYPYADPSLLVPGSLVFRKPRGPVDLRDYRAWWEYAPGASWHRPEGPGSTLHGREQHPVVHVAYEDALAYAAWSGKELPTEAEWEFAARGGLEGATYIWGDEFAPEGRMMANTWQGRFPWQNLKIDGYEGTSPVRAFPANGYGLHDMAGNVWEWTSDSFAPHPAEQAKSSCCVPRKLQANSSKQSHITNQPGGHSPRRVVKGGSYLCAPNYCLRYRPAARQGESVDTSAHHIGIRCVVRTSAVERNA
ncbi:MAG TPA: formylglycine-generating enzyme family protein [Rubrobacter sp.]|nr:formylglycine-generating enzyme family protein [Rubrobacter sp.]